MNCFRSFRALAFPIIADRRGVVAIIVALCAPVLIGCVALAIDVSYWYGTKQILQNAADAAAMSAAMSNTTGATATSIGTSTANGIVNPPQASQQTAFSIAVSQSTGPYAGSTLYTVRVSEPAPLFFSAILTGFRASNPAIAATASVLHQQVTVQGGGGCVIAFAGAGAHAISASGGAGINASNCGVFSNSNARSTAQPSALDAITVSGSGYVKGTSVGAVGGVYVPQYSGYVGGSGGNGTDINQGQAAMADPLAAMGDPPPMPTLPTPTYDNPTSIATSGYSLAYEPVYSQPWGGCVAPAYSASCYMEPGSFINGINASNTTSFIAYTGSASTNGGNTYAIDGEVSLGHGSAEFQTGTYYLDGGGVSYAITVNLDQFTIDGGTYYVDGGMILPGSGSQPFTFGPGQYFFQGTTGLDGQPGANNGGTWALSSNVSNVTFTGGTYFFNGGLNLSSYGTITFGPGIYYIANGNLNIGGSDSIIVNGATFVLEDGAGFVFNGGSNSLNMQSPSSNCVQPSNYPQAAWVNKFPYDGTNGEGICGVLIYQARSDPAPDLIVAGAKDSLNGVIYNPSAALVLSGAGSLSAAPITGEAAATATLALLANTISLSGSATINVSDGTGSAIGPGTTTMFTNTLVQ